jgi:scyllo-inositol 2-dehydrogenase (NADP+)
MNTTPIKTGLLSFGMSGKVFHAPFLNLHPGFELCSVVERSEKKAFQYYPDIKSYDSVEGLLSDPDIELVVVSTPTPTHFDFAFKALKAGKHVLQEKAFTVTTKEASILYREAEARGLQIFPYQNRRFDSDFTSVQEVIDSDQLGKLVEVHVRFDRYRPQIGPKIFKETLVPGSGLLFDLGPHLLDQVLSLFGNPIRWTKTLGYNREKTLVDDYFHFHLEYPNGLQVFVTANMLVTDAQPAYVLHGSRGSFVKYRTDVQEKQLVAGMRPDHPEYGLEETGSEGILSTVSADGQVNRQKISLKQTSYMGLFDAVYRSIRFNDTYSITEEQVIQQLNLLENINP